MKSWRLAALPLAVTLGAALLVARTGLHLRPKDLDDVLYLLLTAFLVLDFARPRVPQVERWSQRLGPYLFLALSLLAVRGALEQLWLSAYDDYFAMGGIVPWSDASAYLRGARALLEFGRADVWAARRMVAVLHYAVLLLVAGQNLAVALWLAAALGAIVLALATNEVLARCGFAGAFAFFIMMVSLFEQGAGRVMTEPIGFLLGTLAFVFIVRGLDERSRWQSLAGLLFLQLAESARPGALVVLPLLGGYYLWHFPEDRRRWLLHIGATFAVGLLITSFIQQTLASGLGQANFAYTLYGVARGGIGWRGVLREHPELMQLADGPRTEAICHLAMAAVRDAPGRFVATIGRTLVTQMRAPFAYFFNLGLPFPYELLFVPAVLGVVATTARKSAFAFLLPCLLGILLSSPFLVDGGPRVFAATLFVPAALAAAGLGLVTRPAPLDTRIGRPLAPILGGVLLLVLLVGPIGFSIRHAMVQLPAPAEGIMQLRIEPGSGFQIGVAPSFGDVHAVTPMAVALSPGLGELHATSHLQAGAYLTSALDRSRPEADQPMYFLFDEPPPFGQLEVRTRLLEAAPFGHTLYSAEVVP